MKPKINLLTQETVYILLLFHYLEKMLRKDDKVRVEKHLCLLLLATITSQVDRVWHKVKPYTIQYCALRFTFHPLHPFNLLDRLLLLGRFNLRIS